MMNPAGYVVFDNPDAPGQGWAARGDQPGARARLISGLHDLSSDVVWILNSEWPAMYAQQLAHHALYRQCRYFGDPLPRVVGSLGVSPERAQDQAVAGAGIAQRVLNLYGAAFQANGAIPQGRLVNAIRERTGPPNLELAPQLDQAISDSSEMFDWPMGFSEEGQDITLRMHPLLYSAHVLTAVVPNEGQEAVWDDSLPSRITEEWVMDQAPMLARFTIDSQPRLASALLNFGATLDVESQRRFVTHYELARLLAAGAKIRVHQTIRWPADPERFRFLRGLVTTLSADEGGAFWASESVALFADALLRGAAARMPPLYGRRKGARYPNLAAPFLHAVGRIHCAIAAMTLMQEGFVVRRVGYGQIGVLMREGDDWKALADLCARERLVPPVFPADRAIAAWTPPAGIDPQDPFISALALRVRNAAAELLELDGALASWAAGNLNSPPENQGTSYA